MLFNRFRPSFLLTAETVEPFLTTHISSYAHPDTFCPRAPCRPHELLNIHGTNVPALVASPCLWESGGREANSELISFQVDFQTPPFLPEEGLCTPLTSFWRELPSWDARLSRSPGAAFIGQLNCLRSWLCLTFVFIPFIVCVFVLACLPVSQIAGYRSSYQRAIRSSSLHPDVARLIAQASLQ